MGKSGIRIDEETASLLAHPLRGDPTEIFESSLAPSVTTASAVIRAAEVVRFRRIAEMVERDGVNGGSIRRTGLWLAKHSTLMQGDAQALVRLSLRLCADPNVLRAYAKGAISQRAAKMIVDFLHHAPSNMSRKAKNKARTTLLRKARHASADDLRAMINHLRDCFDDSPPADDVERNTLSYPESWHKRTYLTGDFDRETGALLRSALSPLAEPRPEPDGSEDKRSPGKRHADAFTELLRRYHALNDDKRTEGGARPNLSVHIPIADLFRPGLDKARKIELISQEQFDELFDEGSRVWSTWMGSMSIESARRLACDCEMFTIGLDPNGAPLSVDSHTRFATANHRRALIARDKGCCFPHCNRPAAWTEAHHVLHWINGGLTVIDNLALLCHEHHRSVHHDGWEIVIGPDRLPRFRPPAYYDPLRRWLGPDGQRRDDPTVPHAA